MTNCHKFGVYRCNEVDMYGKKEAGTGEHLNTFNQINKHKWKAAAPHGRLPHTKHKLKPRPGPLSSSTVVTPHLTLPKLLRGTRDRWPVQVSFITNYSTGLAPFPRLSAPPHSPHTPIAPRRPGGTHETALYSPPSPLSRGEPVRAAAAYLGVRTDEAREKETEGWGVTETRERKKNKNLGPVPGHTAARSSTNWAAHSRCHAMVLDLFGGQPDAPSASWRPAMAPPVEGSRQRVPRSLLLHQPGEWQQAPAHWRTAATPPLPLGWQPPLLVPGARQRVFRPTCSSFAPAPPLRAATGGLRHFLLPDLLSTAIPLSSEGSLTACPSFLPGFGTNVMKLICTGRRREPANI